MKIKILVKDYITNMRVLCTNWPSNLIFSLIELAFEEGQSSAENMCYFGPCE